MITGVQISSSEMVIQKDGARKDKTPEFQKDQTVNAKVLKQLSNGRTLLLVNGRQINAKTSMLLTPGEEVQLRVTQEKDNIVLKLIGPVQKLTTSQLSSAISLFSKSEVMTGLFKTDSPQIKTLLNETALQSGLPDKDFLPRLIDKGGLVWENKIANTILGSSSAVELKNNLALLLNNDIKGNLLAEFLSQGSVQGDNIKTAVSFLETLENFQLINNQSSDSGRYLLPFPVLEDSGFNFGQLLIDTGENTDAEHRSNEKKVINISFLLDMTRLGPLRADFSLFKKEINGRFLLANDDTRSYLESMIPELEKKLARIKYHVHKIECQTAKQADLDPGVFVEKLFQADDDRVVNIVV